MTAETSNARGEWVLVPRNPTEAMLDAMHSRIRILCDPAARTADIQNDREVWAAMLAVSPPAPISVPLDRLTALDGLVDRIAEAIRDGAGLAEGDPPWERLGAERRAPWRADAKRALSVIKESLTAETRTPPPADAEVWLFKGTDGAWHTFHNEQHRLDTIADGRWDVRKFYALPPPAAAEPKTLPVPTRVYLTDKAAVIVGDPQRGWDEEGPDAHNCDDMGCSTIGPHVLARVPFTDERSLAAAQQQGQAVVWVSTADIAPFVGAPQMAEFWGTVTLASGPGDGRTVPLYLTAPPSAPVGVEGYLVERLHGDGYGPARVIVDAAIYDPTNNAFWSGPEAQARHRVTPLVPALAQQPAAVDEAAAIRAFEEHFQASSDDPYFEGELELWLTAWRKALAAQQQGGSDDA